MLCIIIDVLIPRPFRKITASITMEIISLSSRPKKAKNERFQLGDLEVCTKLKVSKPYSEEAKLQYKLVLNHP